MFNLSTVKNTIQPVVEAVLSTKATSKILPHIQDKTVITEHDNSTSWNRVCSKSKSEESGHAVIINSSPIALPQPSDDITELSIMMRELVKQTGTITNLITTD